MIRPVTPDEVREILTKGTFDDLIGALEDEGLECKGAPYYLLNPGQKMELAKDVAGAANLSAFHGGGAGTWLLLGVQTAKSANYHGEAVVAVSPFEPGLVDRDQYYQVLKTWIDPVPEGIEITWYPSAGLPDRGIVGIWIPPQRPERWPFLLKQAVDDNGKIIGTLFGYFERRRDQVDPVSLGEIHRLIRDGRRNESVEQRFDAMMEAVQKLSLPPAQPLAPSPAIQSYLQRFGEAATVAGLKDFPVFGLAAIPVNPVDLPDLFRGNRPLVEILRNPPRLRHGGWTPRVGEPEIVQGKLRRATNRASVLECWRDGTLLYVAEFDMAVGWGTAPRINPLGLVELTYTFATLAHKVYESADPPVQEVEFRLALHHLDAGERKTLSPHGLNSMAFRFAMESKPAPEPDAEFSVRVPGPLTPGVAAYKLLRQVYAWFGFEEEVIPYVAEEDGQRAISAEVIIREANPSG